MNDFAVVVQSDDKILYSNSISTKSTKPLGKGKDFALEHIESVAEQLRKIEKSVVGNNELFTKIRINQNPNEKVDESFDFVIILVKDRIHDRWTMMTTGKNQVSIHHHALIEDLFELYKMELNRILVNQYYFSGNAVTTTDKE